MSDLVNAIREAFGFSENVSSGLIVCIFIVGLALVILSVVALVISICLAVCYHRYNKMKNSIGKTGEEIAREILDRNGLNNIRVSKNGSVLFGNSYSHYFKKVRLRRLTWKKDSVTSLAMAAQKSSLAVLDKENDPAMRFQIKLTPIIYFGPLAFVPLILIGVLLDLFIIKADNVYATITCCAIGLLFYVISFVFSILMLKTEKKAQERALELMKTDAIANDEEIEMCRKLFRYYNIEYINNMIIALLELVYRVLLLIASAQDGSSLSTSKD